MRKRTQTKQRPSEKSSKTNQSVALVLLAVLSLELLGTAAHLPSARADTEILDNGHDLTEGISQLVENAQEVLIRAREPRTQMAKAKGGQATPETIQGLEMIAKIHLETFASRPTPEYIDSDNIWGRQERTVRLRAAAGLIQALLLIGQIRAYLGTPFNAEDPRFLDGTPAAIEMDHGALRAVFAYTNLFEDKTFQKGKWSAPHSPLSTRENQTLAVGNAVLFRSQGEHRTQIVIKPELLRQLSIAVKNQIPNENSYFEFVRNMTLMELAQLIGVTSWQLKGPSGILDAAERLGAKSVGNAILREQFEKAFSKQWSERMWAEIEAKLAQAKDSWMRPRNVAPARFKWSSLTLDSFLGRQSPADAHGQSYPLSRERLDLSASLKQILGFQGVVKGVPVETIKAAVISRVLDYVDAHVGRDALPVASTELHQLNWNLPLVSSATATQHFQAEREENDLAHWEAAKVQAPLWRASQGQGEIPADFLDAPVVLPILRTALSTEIAGMGLKSSTALSMAFNDQTWGNEDPSAWEQAQFEYWGAVQTLEEAQSLVPATAVAAEELQTLKGEVAALRKNAPVFGFERDGATPSVRTLFPTQDRQKLYLDAYLDSVWTQDTLLDPRTWSGNNGLLLTQLERLKKQGPNDKAFEQQLASLMTPALNQRLTSSFDAFTRVQNAKTPEDLADLLYVSPHVNAVMNNLAPGMSHLISQWRNRNIALSQRSRWGTFSGAYSTPALAFLSLISTQLLFKFILRPVGYVAGAGLAAFGARGAAVSTRAFMSPLNPFARWAGAVHAELAPHFSRYFNAFLGVIAVDILRNGSSMLEFRAQNQAMHDQYLAQHSGFDYFRHSQLELRASQAEEKTSNFIVHDILLQALLFGGIPIASRISDSFLGAWEARLARRWKKIGVELPELYQETGYWNPRYIKERAQRELARIEKTYADRPDLAARRDAVLRDQEGLLKEIESEILRKEIALVNFTGEFKTLRMSSPQFNLEAIDRAFQRRIHTLTQRGAKYTQSESIKQTLALAKNRAEIIKANRAHATLHEFAQSYTRTFRAGPLTQWITNATMLSESQRATREAESQVRQFASRMGLNETATESLVESSIRGATSDVAKSWEFATQGPHSFKTYQDQLALALSEQYKQRGNEAFGFWPQSSSPQTSSATRYVNILNPETPATRWDTFESPYKVLGVDMGASQREIEDRFFYLTKSRLTPIESQAAGAPIGKEYSKRLENILESAPKSQQLHNIDKSIRPVDPKEPQRYTAEEVMNAFIVLSDVESRTALDSRILTRWDYLESAQARSQAKFDQKMAEYEVKRPEYEAERAKKPFYYDSKNPQRLLPAKTTIAPSIEEEAFLERYSSSDLQKDLYAILGVPNRASITEVREAANRARAAYSLHLRTSTEVIRGEADRVARYKLEAALDAQTKLEDPVFKTWYDYARGLHRGADGTRWWPTWKR